jgi:hypothetical protein
MKKLITAAFAALAIAAPAQAYMENYMLASANVLIKSTAKFNEAIAAEKEGDRQAACLAHTEAYMLASYAHQKLVPNPHWFIVEPKFQQAIQRTCSFVNANHEPPDHRKTENTVIFHRNFVPNWGVAQ